MKYYFEKYSGTNSRYLCPKCGKKEYVRFVNEEGKHLSYEFGRCNREIKCGYYNRPNNKAEYQFVKVNENNNKEISYIDNKYLDLSLKNYNKNNFIKFIYNKFGINAVKTAIDKYKIGTSCLGGTIFWQIDKNKKIRTGKIIFYNKNGKRLKKIFFVHKKISDSYNLQQCFFGEHLIENNKKTIIVESEKTAVICAYFYPEYNWLASGGLGNLSVEKILSLFQKEIILIPDVGSEDKWEQIISRINRSLILKIIKLKGEQGEDLADLILKNSCLNSSLSALGND